jgi:colanic acid/amylovoran biosynthesis glycosyltransferase
MTTPAPRGDETAASLTIAYLVNCYPAASHTFIRREIQALERLGCSVQRFAVRPAAAVIDSDEDRAERARTEVLLAGSRSALLWHALVTLCRHPLRGCRAAWLALRLGSRSDRGLFVHLAYLVEAAALARRIGRRVQLLHAHFGTNSAFVAMLCHELGGPPFSMTVHGPEEFERSSGIHLREKVERARFVVAISEYGRTQIWRFTKAADWPKVVVVRCGVDGTFLAPPSTPLPGAPELLWIGRLAAEKGIPILLAACRLLLARGIAFRLTMVGGGPLQSEVERELASADLGPCLRWVGWAASPAIRDHLDRSLGLVVASFAEGLPVVLMEALARARPVVATAIAGIPELVQTGATGWLVPAGRTDLLADAMQAMLGTPTAELAKLGDNGRRRVAAAHDADREAGVLLQAMRTAIAGVERRP